MSRMEEGMGLFNHLIRHITIQEGKDESRASSWVLLQVDLSSLHKLLVK